MKVISFFMWFTLSMFDSSMQKEAFASISNPCFIEIFDTLVLFAGSIFTSSHTSPLYLINEEFFQLSAVATYNVHLVEDFLLLSSFSVGTGALVGVSSKKELMVFCRFGGIMFVFSFSMFATKNLKTN